MQFKNKESFAYLAEVVDIDNTQEKLSKAITITSAITEMAWSRIHDRTVYDPNTYNEDCNKITSVYIHHQLEEHVPEVNVTIKKGTLASDQGESSRTWIECKSNEDTYIIDVFPETGQRVFVHKDNLSSVCEIDNQVKIVLNIDSHFCTF